MTDNEIIKALEHCSSGGYCKDCPAPPKKTNHESCWDALMKKSVEIINRQKAEIDRLNHVRAELSKGIDIWIDIAKRETGYVELARAEAIKEFAEKLKDRVSCIPQHHFTLAEVQYYIDNLAKEMTEETST